METAVPLDIEAIRGACVRHGVARLQVFGSVLTDRFEPEKSDIDFLVSFLPNRENLFEDFLGLKSALEAIHGREIDLVMERSLKNPFLRAAIFANVKDVYAA